MYSNKAKLSRSLARMSSRERPDARGARLRPTSNMAVGLSYVHERE
jgi:hypothetical protein